MAKYNEQSTSGKGGEFRVEKNERFSGQGDGAAANLKRFGSLAECIECVIAAGAYISFGRTTDGGATLIRVLDGGDKLSSYCHSSEEIMEAMAALQLRYKRGFAELTVVPPPQAAKSS